MQLTDALREAVIATAREAAAEILRVYDTCFDVDHKADDSPLTAADLAAHRCIVDRLEALTPDIPVLSEESADTIPTSVRRTWTRLWVVDPRSEEHTSELQSLMRSSYAVFCLKKKKTTTNSPR